MLDDLLTNPRADRVKAVRALAGRSVRRRSGTFLVEGPQAVREAVAPGGPRVHDVFVTPDAEVRYPEIVDAALVAGARVRTGTPEVLDAMSPDAQGVVAVVDLVQAALAPVLAARPRLVAVLAHVRDPGNAGTVLRASDAAGADAVVLTASSVDVHNPKCVRATAGSLFHLPVVTGPELGEAVTALRTAGLQVLAAAGTGSHDLDDLLDVAGAAPAGVPDLTAPTAWVFGNEAWGLRDEDLALADAAVRVPLRGRAESLNLATAAAVCLYASGRAQR
ncbi:TrmH family RNA methyltransferase [Cellulomonas xiejunii]|uniref:RNA methyltransferase n=1 Tax=Cellulomonas xiejunii TaxID=2968083 RepID=A0ABY5KW74_9CELL|nr:RNA methyltransferase [Cellulomonas xiejunii]MCC2322087.1 RNA methyltransferase [Cellulomonas xiejunii]UUI73375.1 RNA methyltransferase [Cellulomonas xiejunii]